MQKYYKKYAPIFLIPVLACFIIAFVIPFFMGIYFSFTVYKDVHNAAWNGVENYQRIFDAWSNWSGWKDAEVGVPLYAQNIGSSANPHWIPTMVMAFLRTTLFAIVCIVTINFNAFILALLLTKGLRGSNIYRSIFFMPNLIGGIVLGYIWKMILNGILGWFGTNVPANAWYGFFGLVILMNWQQVGYMMIIYIAALMNVPTDLNESAQIDGASKFQTTMHVTIPMILPSVTICTFLTLANSYKLYDQNLALSGLNERTNLMAADIVATTGPRGSLGPEQAKAVLFFIIVALISLIQVRATRTKEVEA